MSSTWDGRCVRRWGAPLSRWVPLVLAVACSRTLCAQNRDAVDAARPSVPASGHSARESLRVIWRDSATALVYTRPRAFRMVTDVPWALAGAARESVRARNLPFVIGTVVGTGILLAGDEELLAETRRSARRVGLPPNHPSVNVRIGPLKFPFPTTFGSGLYFLGDGLTTVGVAAGFAVRGSLADDARARRVASESMEALLAAGTVTQVLKHISGRQTPSEATVARGRWRPLPSLRAYNRNVPAYDAFPSGHLASTMATVTVVALNYREHQYVWPVGAAAMGALSFAMVNNGVHWASDYPAAIAIGGVIGKVVVDRGRTIVRLPAPASPVTLMRASERRIDFAPLVTPAVIGLRARF